MVARRPSAAGRRSGPTGSVRTTRTTATSRRGDARDDEDPAKRAPGRPALRTVGKRGKPAESKSTRKTAARAPTKARRRRRTGPADVEQEIARLAGRNSERYFKRLMDAADAYSHDREREALRLLRPLRDQLPDSPSVRELVGLCQYRVGNYNAAVKELEAYAELSDAVDQNPVLMDCYRAQRRWRKVETAWEELAAVSPSGDVVAEGRIVYAGALADQGRIDDALGAAAQTGRPRSAIRRSTTSASGTRSPTSRSAPATSPAPASSSTACARPTRSTSTSPSGAPPSGSCRHPCRRFAVDSSSSASPHRFRHERGKAMPKETKRAVGDEPAGPEPERGLRPVLGGAGDPGAGVGHEAGDPGGSLPRG